VSGDRSLTSRSGAVVSFTCLDFSVLPAARSRFTGESLELRGAGSKLRLVNIGVSATHMQPETTRLDHLAVIEFAGPDAGRFLQAQLTADVAALSAGQAGFACCCNPAGRALCVLLLHRVDPGFMAICAAPLAETLADWLRRFVLRAKVTITLRPDLAVYAGSVRHTELPALPTAHGAYELGPAGAAQADNGAFRQAEIEAGLVWLDAASSGAFLPQMIGMERLGALSFKKGCYPGQEIIARARHLGKLKRHPLLCFSAGHPLLEVMQNVELATAEGSIGSAVVAGSEKRPDGGSVSLLVARLEPSHVPVRLGLGDQWWPLEHSRWLTGTA